MSRATLPAAAVLACFALSLFGLPAAHAEPFAPPPGKVWHGLTGENPTSSYEGPVGKHVAVRGTFIRWGGLIEHGIRRATLNKARLLLHISTASGQHQPGVISPGGIAKGKGDSFLVGLSRRLARHGEPVYLRWLGEMNNCDNAYSSRRCDGSLRSRNHTPGKFKRAWRRAVLIMRGGDVATIDDKLAVLGMPPVKTDAETLPEPQVAFIWSPMTGGSPLIPSLRPGVFWPGSQYVDWVGTSFYSKYPNFHWLTPYYKKFAVRYSKPFAFVEWALWDSESPGFVHAFFKWVRNHGWTKLISYNHGGIAGGPFQLTRYPRSAAAIRSEVSSERYLGWAAEWRE